MSTLNPSKLTVAINESNVEDLATELRSIYALLTVTAMADDQFRQAITKSARNMADHNVKGTTKSVFKAFVTMLEEAEPS